MRELSVTKLYIKQRKLKVLLTIFWQVIGLCLAVWIDKALPDCFMVLMEICMVYFAKYLESACGSAPGHGEGSVPWSLKIRSDKIFQTKQ
ncbi:hypothetical protein BDR06DRAFT_964380 [Suillus hirtellus]|nr:hypothetical protein BDR06DRAFT_964380 [Suillus hirtellus]